MIMVKSYTWRNVLLNEIPVYYFTIVMRNSRREAFLFFPLSPWVRRGPAFPRRVDAAAPLVVRGMRLHPTVLLILHLNSCAW